MANPLFAYFQELRLEAEASISAAEESSCSASSALPLQMELVCDHARLPPNILLSSKGSATTNELSSKRVMMKEDSQKKRRKGRTFQNRWDADAATIARTEKKKQKQPTSRKTPMRMPQRVLSNEHDQRSLRATRAFANSTSTSGPLGVRKAIAA